MRQTWAKTMWQIASALGCMDDYKEAIPGMGLLGLLG